ncbi:MAG: nuclear transport factor 2 family protein [Hyphomonadaceae bacterium]|nr:nuclear transport factor 2 family protein [Hyphomonadaceae bacterium]
MVDHAAKVAAVEAYIAAFANSDPDAVVAIFAEDATVEDPIGTPIHKGHAAIREFYAASMKTGAKLSLDTPVRTAEGYAAFAFTVKLNYGGEKTIQVIDTFKFNDAGKVIEMRAFWSPNNMTGF